MTDVSFAFFTVVFLILLVSFIVCFVLYMKRNSLSTVPTYNHLLGIKFVYKIDMSESEVFESLRPRYNNDVYTYKINETDKTITLTNEYTNFECRTYSIKVFEYNECNILQVEYKSGVSNTRETDFIMNFNHFWKQKVNAEPVPYDKYARN